MKRTCAPDDAFAVVNDQGPSKRHESERQSLLVETTPLHRDVLPLVSRYAQSPPWRALVEHHVLNERSFAFVVLRDTVWKPKGPPTGTVDNIGQLWGHSLTDATLLFRDYAQLTVLRWSNDDDVTRRHQIRYDTEGLPLLVNKKRAIFRKNHTTLTCWDFEGAVCRDIKCAPFVHAASNNDALFTIHPMINSVAMTKSIANNDDFHFCPTSQSQLACRIPRAALPLRITKDEKWLYRGLSFWPVHGNDPPLSYKAKLELQDDENVRAVCVSDDVQHVAVCIVRRWQRMEQFWDFTDFVVTLQVHRWGSFALVRKQQFTVRHDPVLPLCMRFSIDGAELVVSQVVPDKLLHWDLVHDTWTTTALPGTVIAVEQCGEQ